MKGRKTFGRKTADIRDKSRLEDITITQSGDYVASPGMNGFGKVTVNIKEGVDNPIIVVSEEQMNAILDDISYQGKVVLYQGETGTYEQGYYLVEVNSEAISLRRKSWL